MGSRISAIQVSPLRAPLSQPFRTALGQHDELDNLLFAVRLSDGTVGYGEAAPAPHITGETVAATVTRLQAAARALPGRDAADYIEISADLHRKWPHHHAALAAVEMALLDALTRQAGIPLWRLFGERPRRLASDITVVIAGLEESAAAAQAFARQGFRAFKIKIGRDEDLDFARVLAVRQAAPRAALYLDANQGYSAEQTLRFFRRLKHAGVSIALLEQPVPREDWEGLKRVTRLAGVPVCADESVRSMAEAVRLIRERAAPVINIKLMKFGLIRAAEIARLAKAAGVGLMIGGMMESPLAMTAAAHLAAGLGGFSYIDLDPPFFIRDGLKNNPVLNARGIYDLSPVQAGIGVIPRRKS